MDKLRSGIQKWSLVFVGIGAGGFLFALAQSYCFNYMGQKLAFRVRLMMMAALLRQVRGPHAVWLGCAFRRGRRRDLRLEGVPWNMQLLDSKACCPVSVLQHRGVPHVCQ